MDKNNDGVKCDFIEIKLRVSLKAIRKCFALIEEDIPKDEDVREMLSSIVVDLSNSDDEDLKQAEIAFTAMAIAKAYSN